MKTQVRVKESNVCLFVSRYLGSVLKMRTSENRTTEIHRSQGPGVLATSVFACFLMLFVFFAYKVGEPWNIYLM